MMEMDVEPRNNIIALHGSRIPQVLGTFQLDDHNVQEWSDFHEAGMKHRARKEIGTWIDRDRNADIKFQRHEDSKRSDTSREQQRTEVIQGNAPDAQFQIIRSHRQFQDSDNKSGARMTSMSTSYQMSTTRGIRTTSKSTSNKTTTKTVTVSGGRQSDDFENLKISFQPLDTSTQRERINVSRSGTMGVRRPPTRRHTPAAATPENLAEESQEEETKTNDPNNQSGLGLKNISPKIRVGFPVEIQLELQSKLRYSNGQEEPGVIIDEADQDPEVHERDTGVTVTEIKDDEEDSKMSTKLFTNIVKTQSRRTWDAHAQDVGAYQENERENSNNLNHVERPKLFGSDDLERPKLFDSNDLERPKLNWSAESSDDVIKRLTTNIRRLSPSPSLSRSWDLIQSAANQEEERKKIFLSSPHLDQWKVKGNPPNRSVVNLNPFEFSPQEDSPRRSPERGTLYGSDSNFSPMSQRPLHKVGSTPDIIHHNSQFLEPATPHKSRLMSLLNETPDLLNKMAFTSHNNNSNNNSKTEIFNKNDLILGKTDSRGDLKLGGAVRQAIQSDDDDDDDVTETIQRLLEKNSRKSTDESFTLGPASVKTPKIFRGDQLLEESMMMDEDSYRRTQVSHTWISGSDKEKPSQRVRDNDVTTSISATSDPYRKLPKKVEFSKTEVHFTPDSGKFHIVETDENKPSTVHLFRRKKRKTSKEEKKMQILSKILTQNLKDQNSVDLEPRSKTVDLEPKSKTVDLESKSTSVDFETKSKTLDIELDQKFTSERSCDEELGIDEQTVTPTRINKDERLSLSAPLSNYEDSKFESEVDSEEDDDDDVQSDDIAALSNYGELKIQRYLKQLQYNNSSDQLSPERAAEDMGDDDDDLGQLRFDSAYENGSFVPLATRRSLIELNNRNNRTKNNKTSSRISDNSSTTSNYSLPLSDAKGDYSPTLKLKTLEAIVDTSSPKPQITSIDLRYGFPTGDSYFDGPSKRNFTRQDDDDDDGYHAGEPVKPEIKSLPPFRSSKYFAQFDVDEEEEVEESNLRPPVPILPSKFSSFEKTGAALRERFNAKTTVRPKPEGREAPMVFLDGNQTNSSSYIDGNVTNSSYMDGNVTNFNGNVSNFDGNNGSNYDGNNVSRFDGNVPKFDSNVSNYIPSKSVVNIGSDEAELGGQVKIRIDRSEEMENRSRIHQNFDDRSKPFQEISSKDPISHQNVPEPILSMDHTWKGPAHFDNQIHSAAGSSHQNRATSVARSLTFPKSSRPEPEWVAKAKSRETRVKDWNLVGKTQQFGAGRKAAEEPPWVTEIRFKSKLGGRNSPSLDTKSLLVNNSIIYPWEKDGDRAGGFDHSTRHQEFTPDQNVPTRHQEFPRHEKVRTRHHELPPHQEVPIRHHESTRHPELAQNPKIPTRHHEQTRHHEPQVRVQSPEIIVPIRKEANVTITELADDEPESLQHEFVQKDSLDSDFIHMDEESNENVQKLLSPILEPSKRARKPLETSGQNRSDAIMLDKPRAPPRPPKPPQRVSSLTNKSATSAPPPPPPPPQVEKRAPPPLAARLQQQGRSEKRTRERLSVPSSPLGDKRSLSGSPSSEKRSLTPQKSRRSSSYNNGGSTNHNNATNNNRNLSATRNNGEMVVNKPKTTPIHNHPLVKVTKIPSARPLHSSTTTKAASSPDGKGSKNKAKHQVVTTTETKIACKSKLMDGQAAGSGVVKETEAHSRMADSSHNNSRPLPKVPPPPTAPLLVSPHRHR